MIPLNNNGMPRGVMPKMQAPKADETEPNTDTKPSEEIADKPEDETLTVSTGYGDASTPQYLVNMGIRIVSHTTIKPTGETPSGVTELAPTTPEVTVNTEPNVTVDGKHEETVDKEPTKTDLETTQQYAKAGGKKKVFGVN